MNGSMAALKTIYIKDISDNQAVDGLFLVRDMRLAETKAGKPFLTLELIDNSGEIVGRVWDDAKRLSEICTAGSVIRVGGQSQLYKSTLQLNISAVQAVGAEEYELIDFLPASPHDIGTMENELLSILRSLEDPYIRKLLLSFVDDSTLWGAFKTAPAAKLMHHAYIGGLLEHTLGIMRMAVSVASHYPSVNKSLLVAGVLLHDFGKVREFSFETPPFNYTDYGRLVGHMVITIELLQEKVSSIKDFPQQTAMLIKHLVLSHHGRYEYGSAVLPMTREALVLHLIDDLDAKMNYLDKLSAHSDDDSYQWTDYQRPLERFMYVHNDVVPPGESACDEDSAKGGAAAVKQPSLWEW